MAGQTPISHIAQAHNVSRKFVYQQQDKGKKALDKAFSQSSDDETVLFYLPVTKAWLRQVVLCLALLCHSSIRGISEFMKTVFDTDMSVGTVHTIIHESVPEAARINASYSLSAIRAGAHDELFQGDMPVLGGMDLNSGYCYLLTPAEHRDADTWAIHLLDCAKQGLHPDYTVADGGRGLRAGQAIAWEEVPCFGDNFHLIREITGLSNKLDKKAFSNLSALE